MCELIKWINENEGFLMIVITSVYVIATILICIFNEKSARAAKEQLLESITQQKENIKIQLSNKRIELLSYFDEQIDKIMSNWEFELSPNFESYQLKNEITIYFNDDFADFYNELSQRIMHLNKLLGDYKHAEKHGECNGRGIQEIQHEIEQEREAIDEYYKTTKNQMINKYLDFKRS